MYDLHQACLDQLNHYLTKALVCSAKFNSSTDKALLINFGLLHFLIISGAHVQFILGFFRALESKFKNHLKVLLLTQIIKVSSLFILCFLTALSAPVMRASLYVLISFLAQKFLLRKLTRALKTLLVIALALPLIILKDQLISFTLSLTFSLICSLSYTKKPLAFASLIYLFSLPLYFSLFTLPHISSVLLNPIFGFLIAFFLLPLSFLSLCSNFCESLAINIWWRTLEFLDYVSIFFDVQNPVRTHAVFSFCYFYFLILLLIEIFVRPYWKRQSYSVY